MKTPADIRRQNVFRAVVREYLRSADPVGSETVVSKYSFGVSPATIRNDMADLEEQGLLEQPHTSAGRVPTDRGYRFYVETFVGETQEIALDEQERLSAAFELMRERMEAAAKEFARTVASLTDETVFMSLGNGYTVVTGMSNLLRKPEFREPELLFGVTEMIDELDRVVVDMRGRMHHDIEVLIGGENPFGRQLSTVITRCEAPRFGDGVIGILGPTRMDYDGNVALMRYVHEIFSRL